MRGSDKESGKDLHPQSVERRRDRFSGPDPLLPTSLELRFQSYLKKKPRTRGAFPFSASKLYHRFTAARTKKASRSCRSRLRPTKDFDVIVRRVGPSIFASSASKPTIIASRSRSRQSQYLLLSFACSLSPLSITALYNKPTTMSRRKSDDDARFFS